MEKVLETKDPITELASLLIPAEQNEIDAVFNVGAQLYKSAQYAAASRLFLFTCMARPLDAKYLSAFGKSRKMMNDFQLAASVFQVAFFLDKDSVEYAVHAAECLLHSGNKLKAKALLEVAKNDPALLALHPSIHQKASAWLELISSNDSARR